MTRFFEKYNFKTALRGGGTGWGQEAIAPIFHKYPFWPHQNPLKYAISDP